MHTTHFSKREIDVLLLLGRFHANKEIAYQLHLSEGTVKQYTSDLMKKTHKGRMELAAYGARMLECMAS